MQDGVLSLYPNPLPQRPCNIWPYGDFQIRAQGWTLVEHFMIEPNFYEVSLSVKKEAKKRPPSGKKATIGVGMVFRDAGRHVLSTSFMPEDMFFLGTTSLVQSSFGNKTSCHLPCILLMALRQVFWWFSHFCQKILFIFSCPVLSTTILKYRSGLCGQKCLYKTIW